MGIFDWIIFGVSIIVFAVGALFMVHQVFCGLDKTALNDKYVWGMNIQGFYFLSASGIGILSVISIFLLFAGVDINQEMLRIPAAIAFGCLLGAQILMAADLGRPLRAMRILLGKNFLSPLTLDFLVLFFLTVLSFVFMFGIFMWIKWIVVLWIWATLFLCVMGMVVHTLLFVPRVGVGYQSEPFHASINMASCVWAGAAVMVLACLPEQDAYFFRMLMIIATAFVTVSALGQVLSDLLAGQKPHTLVFFLICFVVTVLLFINGFIVAESQVLLMITAVLAIAAVCFEKNQTILHLQTKPVIPLPYSQYERHMLYKPVLSEWLNVISGVAAVVAVTYAVIIVRTWILPWLAGFIA